MISRKAFRGGVLMAAGVLLLGASTLGVLQAGDRAGSGLEQLKQLAGRWEGVNSKGAEARVSFEVTAGGSVVLERLKIADHPEMLTLYYRDGDKLMLTHFCMAGNQPRMLAKSITPQEIQFDFVDASNLASPEAGHMHRARLSFPAPGQFQAAWTWNEKGQDAFTEVIKVKKAE